MAGPHGLSLGAVGYHWSDAWWLDYAEYIVALGLLREPACWFSCHAGIDFLDAVTA